MKSWRFLNRMVLAALVVGLGAALLWIFSIIWTDGKYYIFEANTLILVLEIVLLSLAVIFGLANFVLLLTGDRLRIRALRHRNSPPEPGHQR